MNTRVKKIINQLTADKKKMSMMLGLLAIAMLLWGRLLLQKVPRTATADPATALVSPESSGTVLGGVVIRRVVRIDPPRPLQRDLFALNPTSYQMVAIPEQEIVRVAKLEPQPVDDKLAAVAVQEAARRLTLQSIVHGARPVAIINGQLIAAGQTIEGFTLSRIDARNVILSKDGIDVRLNMD